MQIRTSICNRYAPAKHMFFKQNKILAKLKIPSAWHSLKEMETHFCGPNDDTFTNSNAHLQGDLWFPLSEST